MPGNSRQLTAAAEREYPVRVRVSAGEGFGQALTKMHRWLDDNCGEDSWKTAPSGMRGMGNDATAFYFRNATIAAAFVARWRTGGNPPADSGAFKMREDAPNRRSEMPNYGWKMPGRNEDEDE
jgi:hypothetical protein